MYAHVCNSVRECVCSSFSQETFQSLHVVTGFGTGLVTPDVPTILSLSLSLFFLCLPSLWLSIFRDEKLTFKLSMSCCLLPLSKSHPPSSFCNWWIREIFSLQTNMNLTVAFPYVNTWQAWRVGRKEKLSRIGIKKTGALYFLHSSLNKTCW